MYDDRNKHLQDADRVRLMRWAALLAFIPTAFIVCAAIMLGVGQIRGDVVKAHQNARLEFGHIVARGPYAGDAAFASYRLVSVRFRNWNREPVTDERMMPWDTQIGQVVRVFVQPNGPAYMPRDLNRPGDNPYDPDTFARASSWFVFGGMLALLCGGLCWHYIYRILVVRAIMLQQQRSPLATP
ncbi:MAG TPA: hypothetical protein VF272_00940 [Candidatus Saccharimonadia bacterium]